MVTPTPGGVVGVKLMDLSSAENVMPPVPIFLSPAKSCKEFATPLIEFCATDLLKVMTMVALRPTPVAPLDGLMLTTWKAEVSAVGAAVKVVTTYAVSVSPARSCTLSCVQTWIMAEAG